MLVTSAPETIEQQGTAATVDVRPILTRSPENAWERTEQIRSDLYHRLDRLAAGRGLKALVLQSHAYVHPAWVKFESWLPTGEPGITARASLTITILTRPYHLFEWIYRVDWEKHGQKGAWDHVYQLGEEELQRMLDVFTEPPAHALTWRRVRRVLKPVQLRQRAYQLWRPRNKIDHIRPDWMLIASVGSLLLGVVLLGVAQDYPSGTGAFGETTFDPGLAPSIAVAPQPVVRPSVTPLPTATNGAAQTSSLDATDQRLDDGKIYEMRTIQKRAGEPLVVTMTSSAFDTYLILGEMRGGAFVTLQTNDDGTDGTNSRIEYMPNRTGEYVVLFSSYEGGHTGAFIFTIQ